MKVYIAGKISGVAPELARDKFAWAERQLKDMGFRPVNPMTLHHASDEWEDYISTDIRELLGCRGVVMLDDWHDSKGARIEYAIAREMGKTVWFAKELFSQRFCPPIDLDGINLESVNHLMEQVILCSDNFHMLQVLGISNTQINEISELRSRIMNYLLQREGL